jgi:hypothetical protein
MPRTSDEFSQEQSVTQWRAVMGARRADSEKLIATASEQNRLSVRVPGNHFTWRELAVGDTLGEIGPGEFLFFAHRVRIPNCYLVGRAEVAELVDALDLGSSGETRGGSSPPFRTYGMEPPDRRVGGTVFAFFFQTEFNRNWNGRGRYGNGNPARPLRGATEGPIQR